MGWRRVVASGLAAGACLLTASCSDEEPTGPAAPTTPATPVPPSATASAAPSPSPSPGDPAYAWPTYEIADLVNPTGWWLDVIPEPRYRAIAEEHPRVFTVNTWHDVVTGSYSRDVNGEPAHHYANEPVPIDPEWPERSVVVVDAETYEVLASVEVHRTITDMLDDVSG